MKKIIILTLFMFPILTFSQGVLNGKIMYLEGKQHAALAGASVLWEDTQVGTITQENGDFQIPYKEEYKYLIISYLGFKTDTLKVLKPNYLHHLLEESEELGEVVVKGKKKNLNVSYFGAQNIEKLGEGELLKAACCSLSESFETNPSIDVSFTDAVTGTKQIQMLGLTSPYIQLTQENIPAVRGAAQAYGMSFIPGTWVSGIQITKGAGSVINGFESITGQINSELKKPETAERFFLNIYGSQNGRMEFNTDYNTRISNRIHTGFYIHGNMRSLEMNENSDNFLDSPLGKQVNIMNRWKYQDNINGWESSLILRYLDDHKQTGEVTFDPDLHKMTTTYWGSEIDTERFDSFFKLGRVFPDIPYQSIGFQAAYSTHQQESYFGLKEYNITHNSFYSNALFQSILGNTYHKFKTGISFTYDDYTEHLTDFDFDRTDQSIGGFFEYDFDNEKVFSINAGIRVDYHNHWGAFVTPRVHTRYQPWTKTTIRASAGRGKRTANIFAENQKIFATNRMINITSNQGDAYGLQPEKAWNYGFSLLQGFSILERYGDISVDYYRTDFTDQVVVDYENPQEINFYNLNGQSFANSLQIGANYELTHDLDIRLAYKLYDVQTEYVLGLKANPLQAKNRFFVNLAYETHETDKGGQWLFDYTFNWIGEQRIPFTGSNPANDQLPDNSPTYNLMNAQITKRFSKQFSIYFGGENLTDYTQGNPILGSDDPFGAYFDSSLVFAPVHGRMFYTGLRYTIPNKKELIEEHDEGHEGHEDEENHE